MKVTKKLIRRCWDPQKRKLNSDLWTQGVLQCRNTPGPDGRSPAEILYGHPVRDMLSAHRRSFAADWQISADRAEATAGRRAEPTEELYNSRAADLPALKVGNRVAIQHQDTKRWDRYGEIVEVRKHRSYLVKLTSGRVLCRNRRHIRRRCGHAFPDDPDDAAAAIWPSAAAPPAATPGATSAPPAAAHPPLGVPPPSTTSRGVPDVVSQIPLSPSTRVPRHFDVRDAPGGALSVLLRPCNPTYVPRV